ncbi:hypothetical protein ACGFYO_02690 [Streptomyces sp. NPDC048201]|uniref:hypothetical protein n=1 Tax=Streptomyces sp. NPDC048201 TaxID=3365513 RepID=UPI0037208078
MRRPQPVGACPSGKLRWRDRIAAQLALAGMDNIDPARRESRAYRCHMCRGWHLTSKPLKGNR